MEIVQLCSPKAISDIWLSDVKKYHTIDTCIILELAILKLTYSIVLSGFFQLIKYSKYSLKAKKYWKTPMTSQFYNQSQQLILIYIFFCSIHYFC